MGDHAAEGCAGIGRDRDVGVAAAEHDHGIAGGGAVGAGAQSPPHPERIDDRDVRAALEQPLDESLGGVGLAGAGGADDGDAIVERGGGQCGREKRGWGGGCARGTHRERWGLAAGGTGSAAFAIQFG